VLSANSYSDWYEGVMATTLLPGNSNAFMVRYTPVPTDTASQHAAEYGTLHGTWSQQCWPA
jgi:hypothetical protein